MELTELTLVALNSFGSEMQPAEYWYQKGFQVRERLNAIITQLQRRRFLKYDGVNIAP
jgi:hypothetical protein